MYIYIILYILILYINITCIQYVNIYSYIIIVYCISYTHTYVHDIVTYVHDIVYIHTT